MGSYGNQPIQCSIDDSVCLEFSVRYVEHIENQYQLAIFTNDSVNYEHCLCKIHIHAIMPNAIGKIHLSHVILGVGVGLCHLMSWI